MDDHLGKIHNSLALRDAEMGIIRWHHKKLGRKKGLPRPSLEGIGPVFFPRTCMFGILVRVEIVYIHYTGHVNSGRENASVLMQ